MPSVNDLKQSRFIVKSDCEPPILVTIKSYEALNVAKEGADEEMRWVLWFNEHEKPLVLNSTNGQIIQSITGSGDFDDWIGQKIVLYVDPNVSFGGKLVGGVRVRKPKNQPQPANDGEPPANEDQIPNKLEDDLPF